MNRFGPPIHLNRRPKNPPRICNRQTSALKAGKPKPVSLKPWPEKKQEK